MTWIEAARGPFERLLEAEREGGMEPVRKRLEGLRLAYLDLRAGGGDRPLAEGLDAARTKGPWVLWMLRSALSPLAFVPVEDAWRRGGVVETSALREMVESRTRSSWVAFFDFWVYGSLLPEYRLRKAEVKPDEGIFRVMLQAENLGTGGYPAPLVVQSEEGARHEVSVNAAPGAPTNLQLDLVTKPVLAAIDPESSVLMANSERAWVPVRQKRFLFF